MSGRLADKVALVVGAGSVGPGWGNGRAIAAVFAREGARVLAADIDPDALQPTLDLVAEMAEGGGQAVGATCDATDSASVEATVAGCLERFGRIDVLVNVVGGSRKGGAAELDLETWQRQLDVNLGSVYRTCHAVLPHLVAQRSGSIVNVASTSGLRWTGAGQVGYAAAKAGVLSFSRVTAVEYGAHGVRCNSVVPGQLHTPMVEARLAGQRAGGDVEALVAQRAARVPLPWEGDGRDTAHAALFLASDEARFVTGTEIVVDGGMTARCD